VRDVAAAFARAMVDGERGAKYLLGGANLTFEAFFERLEIISGIPRPRLQVPDGAALAGARFLDAAMRFVGRKVDLNPVSVEMSQHYWYIDWSAAMRDLDFAPRDPGQTLYDTVQWLRQHQPSAPVAQPEPLAHPFAPDQPWEDTDLRHAAFSVPEGGEPSPVQPGTSIPYRGQSKISYDTMDGGPGLESLIGGAIKGAVGSFFGSGDAAPAPPSSRGEAQGPSAELDELLSGASEEELETVLRLVRRMKPGH
jgi:hypothetical protein